jgi:hypothetical protein
MSNRGQINEKKSPKNMCIGVTMLKMTSVTTFSVINAIGATAKCITFNWFKEK